MPYLFTVFIDDVINVVQCSNLGCKIGIISVNMFLYADDIILLAPSVDALQKLLSLCELHVGRLDMALNPKKSVCVRIGAHYRDECVCLSTLSGELLRWVDNCRYLGTYIVAAKKFKISISNNKKCFYRAFNSVFSKVGRSASEEVLVKLFTAKCLPMLLYGLDACPVLISDNRALDFITTRVFMRIFKTSSADVVNECQTHFKVRKTSETVNDRKRRFLHRYATCDNSVCSLFSNIALSDVFVISSS